MLVLTPNQEKPFVDLLKAKNVPVEQITPDPRKVVDIKTKLSATIASFSELKDFAQGVSFIL